MFDFHPALVLRPADKADISRAVKFAGKTGTPVAVRSGNHSLAGHGSCDDCILIDLSTMKELDIDVEGRTAWAETGLTAGEYTVAVGKHGLATGFGDTGSVGIGGITLGGGFGYLVRKYGLTIDELLAADVVTGGMLILPATPKVLVSFIEEAQAAPDDLSAIANVMKAPPMPFLPPEYHGKVVLMGMLAHSGDPAEADGVIGRFRSLATPIVDMVKPIRYPELFPKEQGGGYHPIAATDTIFTESIDERQAESALDRLVSSKAQMAYLQLRALGGAMARVGVHDTAFAHRTSRIMATLGAIYEDPAERVQHEAWVADFLAALRQGEAGSYVNFMGAVSAERVRAAYPGPTWDRLVAIKNRYDPANVFRFNQNIQPSG